MGKLILRVAWERRMSKGVLRRLLSKESVDLVETTPVPSTRLRAGFSTRLEERT